MSRLRVLLTAFEPFDGEACNASQRVAEDVLPSLEKHCDLQYRLLPVARQCGSERIIEALDSCQPDVVVMLGQAGKRRRVTPERVAINLDWFHIPDNAGEIPRGEAICADGPVGYFSTLPVVSIAEKLETAGVAARVSNTAGLYVCNHVFYRAMHHIGQQATPPMAGFIHLPRVSDPADSVAARGLPLATMATAVELAVTECLVCRDPGL